MRRIFTLSLALVCLNVISNKVYAQCGNLEADFNGTAMGFTGSTTVAGATFSYNQATSNNGSGTGELRFSGVASGSYVINTATYDVVANDQSIGFGFTLGGSVNVSSISVRVFYVDKNTMQIQPGEPLSINSVTYTAGKGTICTTIPKPSLISGTSFRLEITLNTTSGNGAVNTDVTFDNFYTTATRAQIVLPVHFSKVAVSKAAEGALVTWNVGTEQNVSGYDVEKSIDGRSFAKIGFVAAQGLSTYSFADAKAGAVNFYRIKSVDLDGRYNFSTVVVLNNGASSVVVKAFMSDKNTLTVQHDAAQAGSRISVVSMDGRVVKMQQPTAGAQQTTVDLSSAQTGLYVIRYDNGQGGSQSIKVVK